jgi:hypothetical protein
MMTNSFRGFPQPSRQLLDRAWIGRDRFVLNSFLVKTEAEYTQLSTDNAGVP